MVKKKVFPSSILNPSKNTNIVEENFLFSCELFKSIIIVIMIIIIVNLDFSRLNEGKLAERTSLSSL